MVRVAADLALLVDNVPADVLAPLRAFLHIGHATLGCIEGAADLMAILGSGGHLADLGGDAALAALALGFALAVALRLG